MTLGDIIREYRTEHGLSQAQFATKSGISKAYVCMLENNKNPDSGKPIAPTYTTFQKVAAVTGYSADDLIRAMDDKQMIKVNLTAKALDINPSKLMEGLEDDRVFITNLRGVRFDNEPIVVANNEQPQFDSLELSEVEAKLILLFRQLPDHVRESIVLQVESALADL